MGEKFEIPKIEKIDTPEKTRQALISLDDDIERVSDLTEKEKAELLEFLNQLGEKIQQFKGISWELQGMVDDLSIDLKTLKDGEFKIDKRIETAKEKSDYKLEYPPEKEKPSPVLNDIALIYLHVVTDGVRKSIILSPEQLKANPILHINGYLASAMIFGKKELQASMGQEVGYHLTGGWENESLEARGGVVRFDDLATKDYSSETIRESFFQGKQKNPPDYSQPPGRLGLGLLAPTHAWMGKPLCLDPEGVLEIKNGNDTYRLPIQQRVENLAPQRGIKLTYYGNHPDFLQDAKIKEKIQKVVDGIKAVETGFQIHLIDEVMIVDYKELNAYVPMETPNRFVILSDYLVKENADEAKNTAEHETIHTIERTQTFTNDPRIRKAYADAKGFEKKSDYHKAICSQGYLPFEESVPYPRNHEFFAFIDEKNYYQLSEGGHSDDNLYEFTTTFLHSTMDIERFEDALNRPIRVKKINEEEEIVRLSKEQKLNIIDHYLEFLRIFLERAGEAQRLIGPKIPFVRPVVDVFTDTDEEKSWKRKIEYLESLREKIK